jgi:hypothetical protein
MKQVALLALVLVAATVRDSDACAPAPPLGEVVRIAEEEALIIWDPATKTETFIRRAGFESTARKFGFLVPTPTTPELSEVTDDLFASFRNLTQPSIQYTRGETNYEPVAGLWTCMGAADKVMKSGAAPAAVRVLATANVAGFNASVLEADATGALTKWLDDNGFEITPQLTTWLDRYVTEKWKVTAFVVAADTGDSKHYDVSTKSVKMTFETERPFYPYREPQLETTIETNAKLAPPKLARMLRLYFLSDQRYAATLAGEPWSAKLLESQKREWIPADLTTHRHLTVFVDESSPRRGIEELYFAPNADQADVKQPPKIIAVPREVEVPVDLIILGALIVIYLVRRARRR